MLAGRACSIFALDSMSTAQKADAGHIRTVVLEVIDGLLKEYGNAHLQSGSVLQRAASRIGRSRDRQSEQALLASFYDLFRTGYLSWGADLANPAPPFCHVTALGRLALAQHSRDPANPDGYLSHLRSQSAVGPVAESYIQEALNTFNTACFKATAVMVGAAAESLVLGVRDALAAKLQTLGQPVPSGLADWRIKRVLSAIEAALVAKRAMMPPTLFERLEANWPAFTHQIRTARNDAGHPVSVDPVTADEVHASRLIFPQLAALATQLAAWIDSDYV
jgi:hypothetical protein